MISKYKLKKIAWLSFQNALRLHKDSILLYKHKSYATSYFLSCIAMEEFGKVQLLEEPNWWDTPSKNALPEQIEQDFLNMLYSHQQKQGWFFHLSHFANELQGGLGLMEAAFSGRFEKNKEKTIYVGLPKFKKKIYVSGKISNPLKSTQNQTFNQITLVNDELLAMAIGEIYQIDSLMNEFITASFNKTFFNQIQKKWPFKSPKATKYFKNVCNQYPTVEFVKII